MKAKTESAALVTHKDTLSRLIGKVESKKSRCCSSYRMLAMLEATLCTLKADMMLLQKLERKKLCKKPKYFRQYSSNAVQSSEIQDGGRLCRPLQTVTSEAGSNRSSDHLETLS